MTVMQKVKQQIEKFWQGHNTPEENQQLLDIMDKCDTQWKAFLLSEYQQKLDLSSGNTFGHKAIERVWEKLQRNKIVIVRASDRKKIAIVSLLHWTIAASLLLVVGVSAYFLMRANINQKQIVAKNLIVSDQIYDKNAGRIAKQITLPDGSKVTLSPGSNIHYGKSLTGKNRNIYLDGKATFDVSKDPSRPFTVFASGFSTTALGTKFINRLVKWDLLNG